MNISEKSPSVRLPQGAAGEPRFEFGKNWKSFLRLLTEARIRDAERSLLTMLGRQGLGGVRFLDAGCGSGLFSLAALRLGAREVVSFDYDVDSAACAEYLKQKFGPFSNWHIHRGSVLEKEWLSTLGRYDVVYCWGVLHHTGSMWVGLENVGSSVADGGLLFVSIYNDQGPLSTFWKQVKRFYNVSPRIVRFFMGNAFFATNAAWMFLVDLLKGKRVWDRYTDRNRGMGAYHDAIDWIGGYPFEVAKPEEIFQFYRDRGFCLQEMVTRQGWGCNEFVFQRAVPKAVV